MKKRNRFYLILTILFAIFLIIGSSYAYYQIYLKGDDTGIKGKSSQFFEGIQGLEQEIIQLSNGKIKLETTGYINAKNLLLIKPIDIEDKSEKSKFRVTNEDYDNLILYSISLTELIISQNLQVTDFKWQLFNHNTSETIVSGDFTKASTDTFLLKNDISIEPRSAHEYELRLWIEENNKDQRYLLNGSFSSKIKIESYIKS